MRNWRTGALLGSGFGVVLALMALIAVIGVMGLQTVRNATHEMVQDSMVKERLVAEWLRATSSNAVRTLALIKSYDPRVQSSLQDEIDATSRQISGLQKKIDSMPSTAEERTAAAVVATKRSAYLAKRIAIIKLKDSGSNAQAADMVDKDLVPVLNDYVASIQAVLDLQQRQIDQAGASIEQLFVTARATIVVLGAAALAAGAALAWSLTRGITQPLAEALLIAETVAGGDLSQEFKTKRGGDFGRLLRGMGEMEDTLTDLVTRIKASSDTIAVASGQIAAGNQDLSQRTDEQASSLEETAAAMEQLTGTVKQNADNALHANQLAQSASEVAKRGGSVVGKVVATMTSINESSKRIADIIGVIDGIAFQTNILALNAAVEAARAGEQGRGFAVVASEVRSLAQRSAAAAKEIKVLIEDSVAKVGSGATLVNQAGSTMTEVVDSIKRVTDIMGEISAASREQTSEIGQVNQAIVQMDQVTQQNAALVEEAAAAAESLRQQAGQLVEVVSTFKLEDEFASAAASPPAAVRGTQERMSQATLPAGNPRAAGARTSSKQPVVHLVAVDGVEGHWETPAATREIAA